MTKKILLVLFILLGSSCSLIKKAAIGPTGMIIYDASLEQTVENDWEMFEKSLYGNIKLLESFLSQDPSNKDLLASLAKAYAAKGYALDETYFLQDSINGNENSIHLKKALISYTKAMDYGMQYLIASGLDEGVLSNHVNNPDALKKELESNLGSGIRDVEAVLYIAQSLGSLVNLQRTNMKIVSYLAVSKVMFDWVCEKKPDINFGMCEIFYATYDAGRPAMLGGNPQKGKEKFIEGIKKYPNNMLIRASFVQYYAIPMLEEEIYNEQSNYFMNSVKEFNNNLYWQGEAIKVSKKDYVSLYNLIAMKRMEIIKKNEKNIF